MNQELKDKLQDLAIKLQLKLQENFGDGQVNIMVDHSGIHVRMMAQGKTDSYLIYENKLDGKFYFIRNWNGVM